MTITNSIETPVIKAIDGLSMTAAGGATESRTSLWFDTSGWAEMAVAWEIDGANTDVDVIIHISSQGEYELNNKTATTDDYVAVTLATAHGDQVYTRKDGEDEDALTRPMRSCRVYVENDSGTAVTSMTVWLEGVA